MGMGMGMGMVMRRPPAMATKRTANHMLTMPKRN
jgi:hypothetical protein